MNPISFPAARAASFLLSVALGAGIVTAQTPISGAQSGTLPAGVYHATAISIPTGQTLTLAAGVIIKFVGSQQFTVNGTLICNGTAASPVIFTDDDDDSAGGDTNANGASVGVPGAWFNLTFGSNSDASSLFYTEIRYGGSSGYTAVDLNASDATFANCTVRDCLYGAYSLRSNSFPSMTNCAAQNCGGNGFDYVPLRALPNMLNNTATGNGLNCMRITAATVTSDLSLDMASVVSGALLFTAGINVGAGVTLTLPAGLIVKWQGALQCVINGTLLCNGTAANPVIFTDDADDSAGGDSNNNGASAGVVGAWFNLAFGASSDASSLTYTEIRYGGSSGYAAIDLNASDATLSHCTVRNCQYDGYSLRSNSFPSITNCAAVDCGGNGFDYIPLHALSNLLNNTATGNALNCMRITAATVTSDLSLDMASVISGALIFTTGINVGAGVTLTLPAGLIVKWQGAVQCVVNGTLLCNGTAANPVIFTDDADDSAGGDSNNNGASTGVVGGWFNLAFGANSDASSLAYTEIRYGGSSGYVGIDLNAADVTLSHCTVRDCQYGAYTLRTNSFPSITNCAALNCGGISFDYVAITALPGLVNNTASGNGIDCLRITSGTVQGPLTIGTQSMIAGAFLMTQGLNVTATGDLVVQQGVVFKLQGSLQHIFNGRARFRGTAYEPIVFTDDADDEIAGDSNGDGPSTGVPGSWFNFHFPPAGLGGRMENVLLRYGGSSGYTVCDVLSGNVDMISVRVEHANYGGFRLSGANSNPQNLVAFDCGTFGLQCENGIFDVFHVTCVGCGSEGIRGMATWTGHTFSSIAWNNGTNFVGMPAGRVIRSCGGFAGSGGNINVDPLFEDELNGDLHLAAGSPCLGAGDFATGLVVKKDHDENPRILDHALGGSPQPDMGAYERGNWHMVVTNIPTLGALTWLKVVGPPGASWLGFGLMEGAQMISPYGLVLAGLPGGTLSLVFPFPVATDTPIPMNVPNDPTLVGTVIGLQAMTTPPGNIFVGNFSELYRVLVRP